jgi:hypothetical protein
MLGHMRLRLYRKWRFWAKLAFYNNWRVHLFTRQIHTYSYHPNTNLCIIKRDGRTVTDPEHSTKPLVSAPLKENIKIRIL